MEETTKIDFGTARQIILELKRQVRYQKQLNKKQQKMKREMLRLQEKLQKLQAEEIYK